MNIGPIGKDRPVARDDEGRTFDLSSLTDEIDGSFLSNDGMNRAIDAASAGRLARLDLTGQRIGPPLRRPGALICIGMNYAAHAAESGSKAPETPVVFLKTVNTVVGPYDDVVVPKGSQKTDWEVELAVVIGRRALYLESPDDADAHIAAYTISNDVSQRAFQLEQSGGRWSKGKCCPTFNPLGPCLVPAAVIENPQSLRLSTTVNGELRQPSSTADMVFRVRYLVWHLSQYMALEAGYVINSGTPEGVALSGRFPYLKDGDVMEFSIEHLGSQRQRVLGAN
jgi:2-keto-4-pentenoate hydratase/2-oxohepta-3-ene-1,7-dioic acid hydratase in catechol pathway